MSRWCVGVGAMVVACKSDNAVQYQDQTDLFSQAPTDLVDILWVVDDSGSMAEEQATLRDGFATFATELEASGTQFQIGVITTSFDYTDSSRGTLIGDPPFLTPADDYQALFEARTTVGPAGSDKEKGLEAALWALGPTMTSPGSPNEGFVRADAQLLVVFVSDEQDCSDSGSLEGQPSTACYSEVQELTPVSEWVQDFQGLKSDPSMATSASIVGIEGALCPEVFAGTRYVEAALFTGGLVGDICRAEWNTMLASLGLNATGIRTKFQLTRAAQEETLTVFVDEDPDDGEAAVAVLPSATDGWTYEPESWYLTFNGSAVPVRGASIEVNYTVDPGKIEPVVTTTAGATPL